jgi:3-isopropylmalate/(R)-2-methylmalate dehydratase small subunit
VKPFVHETGRVAVLDRADVDTDQIIPKQFLKKIGRTGYGEHLFHDWRFDETGEPHPGFELHQPHAVDATILLAGRNFGCGSSREHAAWALQEHGFVVVIAPSFGDIFRTNASKIGLLTVELPEDEVKRLMESIDLDTGSEMTIHLERRKVIAPDGREIDFVVDETVRHLLLHGLDEIALTLQREHHIDAHERARGIA